MKKNTGEITNQRASLPDTFIREANRQDAELIVELGKRAFYEAFAEQTAPEDMAAYLQTTFPIDEIKAQLSNKDSLYLIIELQADPVGYAYLYPTPAPASIKDPKAIQLIRFYLLKKCYGLGVGNALMQTCLDESRARSYRSVWLSSWELNGRANAFYKKWHFKVVGRQKFVVGSDVQNDHIFRRDL
jgi:ribosomal protein S18 acetylase RimI-like enzyme